MHRGEVLAAVLAEFGGIRPVTRCAKHMLNGPGGGGAAVGTLFLFGIASYRATQTLPDSTFVA